MHNSFTIKSYQVPDWVKEFVYEFGGFGCESIESISGHIDTLLIYEDTYLQDTSGWHDLLANNCIGTLIIFNFDPYKFTGPILTSINDLAFSHRLRIFCTGFYQDSHRYPNVFSRHLNYYEHLFSHHVIFLLSRKLKQRREPTMDFLWLTVPKDNYRRHFVDSFAQDTVLSNSIVSFGAKRSSQDLYNITDQKLMAFEKNYGTGGWLAGLRCYGSGLPNIKAYEQVWCEIVFESANVGSWKLSEKFFRPISLGIPIIMPVDRSICDKIKDMGYRFYDHGDFYQNFHGSVDMQSKVRYLREFMIFIKDNRPAEMQEVADHNYDLFWNQRKNDYYDNALNCWKELVDKNSLFDDMYGQLDA